MPRFEFGLPIYEPNPKTLDLDDSVKYNFVLVNGAFNASYWYKFARIVEALGHNVIEPSLPIGDPKATFLQDTEAVKRDIGDLTNIVMLHHSRGIETARVFNDTAIDLGRFVSFQVVSSGGPRAFEFDSEDSTPHAEEDRYMPGYDSELTLEANGLYSISPSNAKKRFFNDLEYEGMASWAAEHLLQQRDSKHDETPAFTLPPEIIARTVVWLGAYDQTLNIPRAIEVHKKWAGIVPLLLPTGHTPQLVMPSLFARYSIDKANRARKQAA